MASPSGCLIFLFLLMPALLALATTPHPYCDRPCKSEVSLHLYLHQFGAWPNNPNPNEVWVLAPSTPLGFGSTLIHDWTITDTTNPSGTIVARAQGTHIQAGQTKGSWYISHNIVFETGRFVGSTLQVMGILTAQSEGQWSIMGGTGEFTMAQGTIMYRNDPASINGRDGIRELDIHVIYTPNAPQAAQSGNAAVANLLGGCNVIDRCCCKP